MTDEVKPSVWAKHAERFRKDEAPEPSFGKHVEPSQSSLRSRDREIISFSCKALKRQAVKSALKRRGVDPSAKQKIDTFVWQQPKFLSAAELAEFNRRR